MKKRFTLETIGDLDSGKIAAAFETELKRVVDDLADRPGDKSCRRLALEVSFTPDASESGVCDGAKVEFKVKTSVPHRRSREFSMAVNASGSLIFNTEAPDNARQGTLDEVRRKEAGQ